MLDFEMEYVFCKDKIGECLFVKASTANELLKLRLSSGSNGSFAFRPKYTKSERLGSCPKSGKFNSYKNISVGYFELELHIYALGT